MRPMPCVAVQGMEGGLSKEFAVCRQAHSAVQRGAMCREVQGGLGATRLASRAKPWRYHELQRSLPPANRMRAV